MYAIRSYYDTYEEIIQLKGVGPYTAAAVASIAFNLPYPTVDGNIYRILARRITSYNVCYTKLLRVGFNNSAPGT